MLTETHSLVPVLFAIKTTNHMKHNEAVFRRTLSPAQKAKQWPAKILLVV